MGAIGGMVGARGLQELMRQAFKSPGLQKAAIKSLTGGAPTPGVTQLLGKILSSRAGAAGVTPYTTQSLGGQ